jgi:hypothetical protein
MIIWLASYPRSGNTLLRTICRRCFGICSYADEPVYYESEFRTNPDLIGHVEFEGAWEDFYQATSGSSDIYLVKTHRLPVDRQPFIYIVRDGRQSIRSYQRFMKHYNNMDVSLTKLILGVDAYGGWSGHYEKWNHRDVGAHLVLRFEDLIDLTDETMARIAAFVKYDRSAKKWLNPMDQLRKIEPNFFSLTQEGNDNGEGWSPSHEYLFSAIHGRLMEELKYEHTSSAPGDKIDCPDHMKKMIDDVIGIVNELVKERLGLLETCEERLALINKLHGVCEERLNVIEKLNSAIHQD